MIKVCQYCGKEFQTRHREQKCCCRECDSKKRSIEKKRLICPVCGRIFFKKECDIKNVKSQVCCSRICCDKYKRKYQELDISCSKDRLHHIWYGMVVRCYKKDDAAYKYYGERGISVCDEWKNSFKVFRKWALSNGYKDTLSIERVNVNGNYEPNNCIWITMEEQYKNKQTTLKVLYKNNLIRLKDIAEKENIGYKDLWKTYKRTENIEEAIRICKLHKKKLIATNKSGHRGVYFYKNKWNAYYKHKYIGRFETFEEAVNARLKAEK